MLAKWKYDILDTDMTQIAYADEERQILKGNVPDSLSLQFHKRMPKGAALRELKKQHLHLSYWETPYFEQAIKTHMAKVERTDAIIGDVGCGDGRFTEFLLNLGFSKIIAVDIDLAPLASLADFLIERGLEDNVLLIHSAVEQLPIKSSICDAVLSIGVLYYLNEGFDRGLNEVVRVLKKAGTLVNSEPNLEAQLYLSLFFETLKDVFENYFERTHKEEKGETPYKFKLFSENEIVHKLEAAGLKVEDKCGISLFAWILRIMMVRGQISKDELVRSEDKVREVLNFLGHDGKLSKFIIWRSVKR